MSKEKNPAGTIRKRRIFLAAALAVALLVVGGFGYNQWQKAEAPVKEKAVKTEEVKKTGKTEKKEEKKEETAVEKAEEEVIEWVQEEVPSAVPETPAEPAGQPEQTAPAKPSGGQQGRTPEEKTPAAPEPEAPAISYCTISVSCGNAAAVRDDYPDKAAVIPESGVILGTCQVPIDSGDTVYEILLKACGSHGVSVDARTTGFGIYVAGIGGLYEKYCGPGSGWMYSVNGVTPGTSCGNYAVSPGDSILWFYVI